MVFKRFRKKPVRKGAKKPYRKRITKPSIAKGLRQAVIPMSREKTFFVNSKASLPTGWAFGQASGYHTIQWSQAFNMLQLPDITELTAVFKAYKLNCVVVSIQSLHNSSMFTSGSAQNYYGGNSIVYAQKNRTGSALDTNITQDYWDQNQGKITRLITGNKTIKFKIYPKISSNTFITSTSQTGVQRSAQWIETNTAGLSVPHHGMNLQFSLTDPTQAFDNVVYADATRAPLNYRVTMKYLFQLRGVH